MFPVLQTGPDARHHVRCGPEGHVRSWLSLYGPLYLAVTCSFWSCLRSTVRGLFSELTSGYGVFSASWFDSGYTVLPVYGFMGVLFPYTAQCFVLSGTCYASVTEFSSWFRCTSRCVPSCRRQATDACHHGRYGPEGAVRGSVQKTADFPQFQFIKVVDNSFVLQRLIPMVLATIEIPQLCVDTVVDAPFMRS